MSIWSRIPFGLELTSNQLIDVGSVPRGNACGCICPSCNTPLVARQGDDNEWHFAHRSQKVHNETRKECEYSFAVSVRLMIRQLSDDGLKFRTPSLKRTLQAISEHSHESADFSYLVTEGHLLQLENVQVGIQFCGVTVDVLGFVEGVPFVIYVTYKDRNLPLELKNPSIAKCGIVELNVNGVPKLFQLEEKGQYKEVLRRYIEEEIDGKLWAYHPRDHRLEEEAIARKQSWLEQQFNKVSASTFNRRYSNKIFKSNYYDRAIKHTSEPARNVNRYMCLMCKNIWGGVSMQCKKCNTHLYTIEIT